MKKENKNQRMNFQDITVFSFKKGSQMNNHRINYKSYEFVLKVLESIQFKNGVQSPKIGLSGYKEDVAMFISSLIEYFPLANMDIELVDDISDFDPDI